MTEITIDVRDQQIADLQHKALNGDFIGPIHESVIKAYEAKKIKVGDLYKYSDSDGFSIHMAEDIEKPYIRTNRGLSHRIHRCTKLPDHLQKSLNEWMDSL